MNRTFIRFFTIADYEEEEAWLRAQHRAGWKLLRTVIPCFYIFEKCPPEDVVYRLDFKNGRRDAAYMRMLSDYGWECFNSCMGWLYFRKPRSEMASEGEAELFTDDAGKLEMLSHIVRTRMLPILVIFLACVLPNCVRALFGGFGPSSFVFFALYFMLLLVYLWIFLHCGRKLARFKRRYSDK